MRFDRSDLTSRSPHIPVVRLTPPAPCASLWLRTETREAHLAVEAEMDVGRLHDRSDLAGLLRGWDAVWRAVWLAASSPTACREAVDELLPEAGRARRWIRSDLADLGGDLRGSPDAGSADRLAGLFAVPADSWGVAYVLRGARLGGVVLAPRVRAQLGLPADCAMRFLGSDGRNTGREWGAFRRRLDGLDLSADELRRAVEAARWTFGWVATVAVRGLLGS